MLKITSPYVRETCVKDDKSGKAIVLKIEPPGHTIGFRERHGRMTWTLPVADAYRFARGNSPESVRLAKPRSATSGSVKDELINVLRAEGKLNIAQIMQRMKDKRMPLDRKAAGEWLETLKEMGKVKQSGFSYELVKK